MKSIKVARNKRKFEHRGFSIIANLIINDRGYSVWDGVAISKENDACFTCCCTSITGFASEFVSRVDRWINGTREFGDDD